MTQRWRRGARSVSLETTMCRTRAYAIGAVLLLIVGTACQFDPPEIEDPDADVRDTTVAPETDIANSDATETHAPDGEVTSDTAGSDRDGDGIADADDCKPDDPAIHPGATEQCDRIDRDCDGARFDVPAGHPEREPLPAPVAYWPFESYEENRDGNLGFRDDSPTSGVPAALPEDPKDKPATVPGVVGKSVEFGGKHYLVVDHGQPFQLAAGTVMFWFRRTPESNNAGLVTKDAKGNGGGGHLSFLLDAKRVRTRLQKVDDVTEADVLTSEVSADTWHHVALSFGPKGFRLYLDGRLRKHDETFTWGIWGDDGTIANREPMVIGANSWSSDSESATPIIEPFVGRIDELLIFDRQVAPGDYYDACSGEGSP